MVACARFASPLCQLIGPAICLALFSFVSAADTPQVALRHIGVLLASALPEEENPRAFRDGLRDAGYIEGRDVVIDWRSANGDYARLPELCADLVRNKVDVIVVDSTPGAQAAKRATTAIPIVMTSLVDPVASGLIGSLAHPGGNVTGLTIMTTELSVKRLQLLKEVVPHVARVAVLSNPDNGYGQKLIKELRGAAPSLSIELKIVDARTTKEFDEAVAAARQRHVQALYVIEDSLFFIHRTALIKLATKSRLPTIWGQRASASDGAFMSYGPNFPDMYRRSAGYVDKILRGANPRDLPTEQPTKFEFVVNLKTAKALGITIPEAVLLRADEVIE
jgi:putative ABC transport system substrate-binding protein